LSEHTDNPEVEDDEMTRVIEPDASEHDSEDEHWVESESEPAEEWDELEEEDELPPRPRNRFLRPLPIALVAVLIAAAGFLGGVLVQKGSGEESGSAGGLPGGASGLASLLEEKAGEGSGSEASSGLPAGLGASGGGSAVSGTVSSIDGDTIYVKDSEGNVVAVKAEDGSTISRDSNVGVKKIHPGDSVVVQGSKHGSTVKASSISATEAGVETTGSGAGALSGAEGEASGGESGGSVESLFGE
jgi:hypothetical protein